MFTCSYIESTSVYVFPLATPPALTKAQALVKAQKLDAKGDKAKAEGNVAKAKFYYGYALRIVTKAGI
jgi:hypothetical protein